MTNKQTPLLSVKNVRKSFLTTEWRFFNSKQKQNDALKNISLDLNKGEILGIVGESGCGKTTLANILLQLVHPDEGNIYYKGLAFNRLNKWQKRTFRREVRMIFQQPEAALNPGMTVRQILHEVFNMHNRQSSFSFEDSIQHHFKSMNLPLSKLDVRPAKLSTGQKKRIGIIRALLVPPKLLIADEPLTGIDATQSAEILHFLKKCNVNTISQSLLFHMIWILLDFWQIEL